MQVLNANKTDLKKNFQKSVSRIFSTTNFGTKTMLLRITRPENYWNTIACFYGRFISTVTSS